MDVLMLDISFKFKGRCWLWSGEKAVWHFVTLPKENSEEIKFFDEKLYSKKRGWGAIRVRATLGNVTWDTSIFPDSKTGCYFLPIKFAVRKSEKVSAGDDVEVMLTMVI